MNLAQEIIQSPKMQALMQREVDKIVADISHPKSYRPARDWRLPTINWVGIFTVVGFALYWLAIAGCLVSLGLMVSGQLAAAVLTIWAAFPVMVVAAFINEELYWVGCP